MIFDPQIGGDKFSNPCQRSLGGGRSRPGPDEWRSVAIGDDPDGPPGIALAGIGFSRRENGDATFQGFPQERKGKLPGEAVFCRTDGRVVPLGTERLEGEKCWLASKGHFDSGPGKGLALALREFAHPGRHVFRTSSDVVIVLGSASFAKYVPVIGEISQWLRPTAVVTK